MSAENLTSTIKDSSGNPAPLGLCAFGLTTILLNLHNAGFFAMGGVILGMGLFYGGLAQVIVGLMEWKKGNSFGTLAFTSYGLFWISLVGILILPMLGVTGAADAASLGSFLAVWGVLTLVLFPLALRSNKALGFVFGSLALLFFLLSAATFSGNADLHTLAGYWGILCGSSAVYTGLAQVYNEAFGRAVVPLWAPRPKNEPAPNEPMAK